MCTKPQTLKPNPLTPNQAQHPRMWNWSRSTWCLNHEFQTMNPALNITHSVYEAGATPVGVELEPFDVVFEQ